MAQPPNQTHTRQTPPSHYASAVFLDIFDLFAIIDGSVTILTKKGELNRMSKKTFVLLVVAVAILLTATTQAAGRTIKVIDEITIYANPGHPGQYGVQVKVTTNYDDIILIQDCYKFCPYDTKHDAVNACATWLHACLHLRWCDIDIAMLQVWDPDIQDYTIWIRKGAIYYQQ